MSIPNITTNRLSQLTGGAREILPARAAFSTLKRRGSASAILEIENAAKSLPQKTNLKRSVSASAILKSELKSVMEYVDSDRVVTGSPKKIKFSQPLYG